MNVHEIYEGWRNHLFPPHRIANIINAVSVSRRKICNTCPHNSKFSDSIRRDVHCTLCGCTLVAKTKCLSCSCPDDPPRWKAVLTDEQEDEILNGQDK